MGKRDVTFDIVRAICIVVIVCFWHMLDYIEKEHVSKDMMESGSTMIKAVLGTFTFMSGYFLRRYRIQNLQDVKKILCCKD